MQDESKGKKKYHKQNFSKMTQKEMTDLVDKDFNGLWNKYVNKYDENDGETENNSVVGLGGFTVVDVDGLTVIKIITENFDFRSRNEFRSTYAERPENSRYSIDFSMVKYIDSPALGMLLMLLQHNGKGQFIKIINCSESVKSIFRMVKFDVMFDVR